MRVHSGEKPFVCSQCNYSCNQADRLRIYMRIHSREKIVMSKLLINCLLQMPYRFFFIFKTYVTTLRTCELVVDDTLDGEINLEKKTREVSEFMVVSHPRSFDCWIKHTSTATIIYFGKGLGGLVYKISNFCLLNKSKTYGIENVLVHLANLAVSFSLLSSMFPNLLHRQRPSSLKLSSGHQKSEA